MTGTHQKTAVVDFDGVLATYDHWRGPDHFGTPIPNARDALQELNEWGWRIVVYTTRKNSEGVRRWLMLHRIPFSAVNSNAHNPPDTSSKPIAEVYFDDRDAHCVGHSPYDWRRAMRRVRKLYQPSLTTDIDDAAAWSGWPQRLRDWWVRWFEPDEVAMEMERQRGW